MQLCDYNSNTSYDTGSVRCREGYQQCKGAGTGTTNNVNNCYPADIWTDTRQAGDVYYMANLGNGVYGTNQYKETLAFSVRCTIGIVLLAPVCAVYGYKTQAMQLTAL